MTKPIEQYVYKNVVETIRDTLDIKDVKQKIVEVVGSYLNADRCFIFEYDKAKDIFLRVGEEYKSSPDILGYIGTDISENIPKFASEFKKGKSLLLNQEQTLLDGQEFDLNDGSFEAEKIAIEKYKVYSALVFPLYYHKNFLGDLVIHYTDKTHKATEDEINFLEFVSNQIAIAIHQGQIYSELQYYAREEKNIREVIEAIRNTISIEETKNTIVNIVGKVLAADRCFLTEYDENIDKFLPIKYEYLSSNKLSSFIRQDVHEIAPNFIKAIKEGKYLLVQNRKIFLDTEEQSFEVEQETIEKFDVNSAFSIPLFYKKRFLGILTIHYIDGEIGNFEINLMKHIANQVSIALFQAKMYNELQLKTKREILLRNITEKIRSSLDIEETLTFICEEISKILNVQRVTIITFPDRKNLTNFELKKEYKITSEIKGFEELLEIDKIAKFWGEKLTQGDNYFAINNIQESDAPDYFKNTYSSLGVKATIGAIISKDSNIWGDIILSDYTNFRDWTKEDKEFLKTISQQIYIAINQAELYQNEKQNVEQEKLLRELTEKIRSSLDIEKTLDFVCEETAKIFNVQRVTIVNFYDTENFENYSIRREYKTNKDLKGLDSSDYSPNAAAYWNRHLLEEGKILTFDNIQDSNTPDYFKNCYTLMGVKSMIGVPIKSGCTQWGTLVLSEYNNYRHWRNEEKRLLNLIAGQVYIAIKQAELYEDQKNMAERERINKNIIEILRSSIDKTIIKKLFVKSIGKFLNANRVFFSEYDSKEKKFMPVDKDSEYLSCPDEKSFIGIDWSNHFIKSYYQAVQEKREVKIYSMDEYLQDKELGGDIIKLIEEVKIKSSYSFPIFYQDKVIGSFCIDFTQQNTRLSDEDTNRIRNMCTQAGIALYHADLYEKAQQCNLTKESFKAELLNKVDAPAHEILNTSIILTKNEFERTLQIEYLNKIINSCKQLLELTKGVAEN